jgi:ribose 5-phosphate isomerase B
MKIAVGNDHRGYSIKLRILTLLNAGGHETVDLGTSCGDQGVDYPDYAFQVAERVGRGECQRGILICGTGIGMSIAANKVTGVRAACCHDTITAEMSRRHNDANVLCLSADLLGGDEVERMLNAWLATDFESGRHQRRIDKIAQFEAS